MNTAVILAAGEGRGAWPFCGIRQKVTLPVANMPMVRRLVLNLRGLGFDRIVVVVGHRAEAVRACLGDLTNVHFVEQSKQNGSVSAALAGLEAVESDEAIIACADCVISAASIRKLIETTQANNAPAVLTAPCGDTTANYTSIESANGVLTGVWGRGEPNVPRFAGYMAGPTHLLKQYLLRDPGIMTNCGVGGMPPVEGNVSLCLHAMAQDGIQVTTVPVDGYFIDVDRPWHLLMANEAVLKEMIEGIDGIELAQGARIDDGADIASGAKLRLGANAVIGKGCRIGGSAILEADANVSNGAILRGPNYLGARTRCEDYALMGRNTIAGNDCIVSHCAEFNGVCFDTVYFYHYGSVTGLVGTNVDFGAATVCGNWRFDNRTRSQNVNGHIEVPEAYGDKTYIGDYCRTGVNTIFMPGVKVGYYSCVGPGVIVNEDVPERTLLLTKQEHITKPWGPERYGW